MSSVETNKGQRRFGIDAAKRANRCSIATCHAAMQARVRRPCLRLSQQKSTGHTDQSLAAFTKSRHFALVPPARSSFCTFLLARATASDFQICERIAT